MEQADPAPSAGETPLAIICGGGTLPFAVAEAVRGRGRRVVLFPVHRVADASAVAHFPHHWLRVGRPGAFDVWREQKVAETSSLSAISFVPRFATLGLTG